MVLVLVLLPALAPWLDNQGAAISRPGDLLTTLGITLGRVVLFVFLMLAVGRRVFPWILSQVARTRSREIFTLAVIAAAVGVAYGSAALFGVSFALGAFFAGMVLRESALSHRAADESLPLRDAFSVLFFVSVGMLFDPAMLIEEPVRVLAVVAIIVIGKSLAAFLIVLAFRYPLNTALTVSASLAQIGEFSFILAGLGVSLKLLDEDARNLILAGALISIALNPFVFSAIEPVQRWIRARSPLAKAVERSKDPLAELPMSIDERVLTGHVVLVGYGRVGRRIAEALRERDVRIVVVEQNRETVSQLRERGIPAVSGDAAAEGVLIQAHIARARMLVIASPDGLRAREMIDIARALKPNIGIVVRTHSDEEAELLRQERVEHVYVGEHELAAAMTRSMVDALDPH
jgi:CPA2 family monovalent cation:H+ antiporter-2